MTTQPSYEYLANLGDANPLDHGGCFIYRDTTGIYPPVMELLEVPCDDEEDNPRATYTVYRVELEPCTYANGVLSDNPAHPEHAAWFAQPEHERSKRPQDTTYLANVASTMGVEVLELIDGFTSADPLQRAHAWRAVLDYHGWENGDGYPLQLTRTECKARYKDILKRRA